MQEGHQALRSTQNRDNKSSPWDYCYPKREVEPEISKLEELLRRNGGSRILDFGCGGGRHVLYFARNGFEVYGFDQAERAIERAKALLKRENLHTDLTVWEMTKPLPYDTAFFDAVLAAKVIQHTTMNNIRRIGSEIDRVLRKGGFIFLQVTAYEGETFNEHTTWVEPGTLIARWGPEKSIPHHFFTREEILALLSNYEILDMHLGSEHNRGYCVIARKRK